jgi:hypothetical protein
MAAPELGHRQFFTRDVIEFAMRCASKDGTSITCDSDTRNRPKELHMTDNMPLCVASDQFFEHTIASTDVDKPVDGTTREGVHAIG